MSLANTPGLDPKDPASGEYRPFRWSFGGRVDGIEVRGEISAEPSDVIGLTYTDTDGGAKYCYNSALADCRITARGNGLDAELTAARRAMHEEAI